MTSDDDITIAAARLREVIDNAQVVIGLKDRLHAAARDLETAARAPRGDSAACDPEAAMLAAAERAGILRDAPPGSKRDAPEMPALREYQDLLGSIWLYIDWAFVTKQLTTAQKELFADAVDAWGARLDAIDGEGGSRARRWWRDDA